MSFIYKLDPYPPEIYQMCENKLFSAEVSKVIVLHLQMCVLSYAISYELLPSKLLTVLA